MKVLVACVGMSHENAGRQPWYYMNSIVAALSSNGHDVWILTDVKTGWPEQNKVIIFENFRTFPRGVNAGLSNVLRKEAFDVIVWSTGLTDFFFKNKIDVLNIPVVAVVTSPRYSLAELFYLGKDLFINRGYIKQFFLGPFLSQKRTKRFLNVPNLKSVVFQCEQTRARYIPHQLTDNRAFVVPPPLPKEFYNMLTEVERERKDFDESRFRILYFGPPTSLRGIDTLIHALVDVKQRVNDVELVILSRIEDEELLGHERRIRKLITKNGFDSAVNIISGLLSSREIVKHILSSDIVCLPFKCVVSDVPIATLEVLSAGVTLITTDVVGVSEFAKNGTFRLVPPNAPKALAESIMEVVECGHRMPQNRSVMEDMANTHNLRNFGLSFDRIISEVL